MANNKGPMKGISQQKAKDFKGTTKKLIRYLNEYKISLIIVFIFSILATVFSIIGPKILGKTITELSEGFVKKITNTGEINFEKITNMLILLLGLYIISAIFTFIQGFIMTKVSQKTTYKLRKEISKKIKKLPMSYFDTKTNGETLSLITNDVDTLSQNMDQSITQLITSIISVIGIIIMMLSIDPLMTLVALSIIPISLILVGIIVKHSQKHFKNQQDYLADINGTIEEMYSGQNLIKAFTTEKYMLKKFDKQNEKLYAASWKSNFLSGLMHPIMAFIGNLGYVIISIIGGYFTIKGRIKIGDIQSFITYTKNFTHPITQIAQISNMLQAMIASAERIFEFLEEQEEIIPTPEEIDISKINGSVEFKNVKFGYDENIIIKNFNAKVSPGQKIAIVGPTGAGKTTIVKLLMRFYNLKESIRIIKNAIKEVI